MESVLICASIGAWWAGVEARSRIIRVTALVRFGQHVSKRSLSDLLGSHPFDRKQRITFPVLRIYDSWIEASQSFGVDVKYTQKPKTVVGAFVWGHLVENEGAALLNLELRSIEHAAS